MYIFNRWKAKKLIPVECEPGPTQSSAFETGQRPQSILPPRFVKVGMRLDF